MKSFQRVVLSLLILIVAYTLLIPDTAHAAKKIRVVTTIPDLADMARQIGGDLVEVTSLTTGVEDPHAVPMKPSFISLLNRADVYIQMGLGNEHAWIPDLLRQARNPNILPGGRAHIDVSINIAPREVPVRVDRREGDIHPLGNPHFNLDPVYGRVMVQAIYEGLSTLYPQHRETLRKNLEAYLKKLDDKIAELNQIVEPLKGLKFVPYHAHWIYFAERYGLEQIGTIEFKPGIEPTPSHLVNLINRMKQENVKIIIKEPQYSFKLPNLIAEKTGAKVIVLPIMVGGVSGVDSYLELIDYNVRTLLSTAQQVRG